MVAEIKWLAVVVALAVAVVVVCMLVVVSKREMKAEKVTDVVSELVCLERNRSKMKNDKKQKRQKKLKQE